MDTSTTDMVTEDDAGDPTEINWTVDLTHMLSLNLGKQLDQMATYRVKEIRLGLRNVDNTNDNNYALAVGGRIRWYSPTQHRIDALQYARKWKRSIGHEQTTSDPFSPWQNDKHYKGIRFNFVDDGEVAGETTDDTSALSGSYLDFSSVFTAYDTVKGGTPAEEGRPTSGEGMALWSSRTGASNCDEMYWSAWYKNAGYLDGTLTNSFMFDPQTGDYVWTAPAGGHISVLGGLLRIGMHHTNTDNPRASDVDDEYYINCNVLVEGWRDF